MRVILLRHGPAEERDPFRWPDDGMRPLTPKGIKRTRGAVRGILSLEEAPTLVWTSPLERAMQTAHLAADASGGAEVHEQGALAPGGSWRALLDALSDLRDVPSLWLVGHEPELGKFAGVLLFGAPAALALKKAGACCIDFDAPPAPGNGRLRWFLTARALAALARKGSRG